MKAKKTSPKSVRFNKEKLDAALLKSNATSIQELVDIMLEEYVNCVTKDNIEINKQSNRNTKSTQIEDLKKLIKSPATKGYFHGVELPEFDPEVGIEGISDPNLPY